MSDGEVTAETREVAEARHRKEVKAMDGERRAALKKAKATKGKKAKDEVATLEADFDRRLQQMRERHEHELRQLEDRCASADSESVAASTPAESVDPVKSEEPIENGHDGRPPATPNGLDEAASDRQRKNEKARRKREKAREKERERERQIEEEIACAGPSARDVEIDAIVMHLAPLRLRIQEVPADGHCLYRAVAAHYGHDTQYSDMRRRCADVLASHEDDFAPFCELSDAVPDYGSYVERVRSSADWGGHVELRALSIALRRPVLVYSAQSPEPLRIEEDLSHGGREADSGANDGHENDDDGDDPIRLSYHRSYYALGEHYNQVVPVAASGT